MEDNSKIIDMDGNEVEEEVITLYKVRGQIDRQDGHKVRSGIICNSLIEALYSIERYINRYLHPDMGNILTEDCELYGVDAERFKALLGKIQGDLRNGFQSLSPYDEALHGNDPDHKEAGIY